jgi:uracil-DNA glycosylase family 4
LEKSQARCDIDRTRAELHPLSKLCPQEVFHQANPLVWSAVHVDANHTKAFVEISPGCCMTLTLLQRPAPAHRMTCADAMALGAMCQLCPLSKGKLAPLIVPSTRVENPEFIVVAEGPGRVEEAQGRPLIGPTGMFLSRLLQEAKLDRSRAYLVNVALCRGETDKEKQRAAECCTPRLLRELAALDPAIPILTLGKFAMKPVLGTSRLFLARGFYWKSPDIDKSIVLAAWRKSDKNSHPDLRRRALTLEGRFHIANRVVLPTIHPAFVLRADVWKPVIQADIRRFGRIVCGELTEETLADTRRPYKVYAKPENIRRILSKMGPIVATDIETDGVDTATCPILCVGISDGVRTVVISPWKPKLHAPLVTEAFAHRRVVGHNLVNFDLLPLRRDGVVIPDDQIDDTLVGHHVIASHFPQRLDHCVSVYLDARPWKIKFGRKGAEEKGLLPVAMTPEERAFYNSCDTVMTKDLWDEIQDDLKPHMAIYRHDMRLARIATQMIHDGIGVDLERRAFLQKKMKNRARALKGIMRSLIKKPTFNPNAHGQVRHALFVRFRAPVLTVSAKTGVPSTASGTLEVYRSNGTKAGRLCDLILKYRSLVKSKSTYIDAREVFEVSGLGFRVRTNWKIYGTPTGRWSGPLQSVPRPERNLKGVLLLESRVREIYVPRP